MTTGSDTLYGLTIICLSALLFRWIAQIVQGLVETLAPPDFTSASDGSKDGRRKRWRIRNVGVSLIHSLVTGVGSTICFLLFSDMRTDLILAFHMVPYHLVLISTGYFVYDFLDMVINDRSQKTIELLLHHVVVIFCFYISCYSHRYIGYSCVALLIELNSVFLHLRSLLNLFQSDKTSPPYRIVAVLNTATFIGCRILMLAWMTRWIVVNKDKIPIFFYTVGSVGLAIMILTNTILLYRILVADYFSHSSTSASAVSHRKSQEIKAT